MSLDTINVDLGTRSYQVRIGQGLLGQAAEHIAPLLHRKKVAVITDDTVAALHLMTLASALEARGITMTALTVPAGESSKGLGATGARHRMAA